jgi:hypothetical protein
MSQESYQTVTREEPFGKQTYVIFIVRDYRPVDLLFQCSDLTWQAYNKWPARDSLYDDGSARSTPAFRGGDLTGAAQTAWVLSSKRKLVLCGPSVMVSNHFGGNKTGWYVPLWFVFAGLRRVRRSAAGGGHPRSWAIWGLSGPSKIAVCLRPRTQDRPIRW